MLKQQKVTGLTPQVKIVLTLVLAVLGTAGNYFSLPLFFGVDFIFGSVAVMVAVILLGTVSAVVVATIAGLYTLVLWGHPFALMIFVTEALVVSLLYRRGLQSLVLADLIYWVLLGVPLVLLFYRGVLGMEWTATSMIAFKQPLNGLFNVLLAGLLVIFAKLGVPALSQWVSALPRLQDLLFHALLTLTLLAGTVPIIYEGHRQRVELEAFMAERLQAQAQQLARSQARSGPSVTELEQVLGGMYSPPTAVAILDDDGRVLASYGQMAGPPFSSNGRIDVLGGLRIWLPAQEMPAMERWREGRYLFDVPLADRPGGGRVLVEAAAAPLVQTLEEQRTILFSLLTGILLLAILASAALSRWIARPLRLLQEASGYLAAQVTEGVRPALPGSRIHEYASLGQALQEVNATLADSFYKLHQARAELKTQVHERTAELAHTADQLQAILAAASEFAIVATDREGLITLFNSGAEKITGYGASAMVGQQSPALFHLPGEVAARAAELGAESGRTVEGFQVFTEVADREGSETREWTFVRSDGLHIPVSLTVTPQTDKEGEVTGYLGIAEDITERKRAEQVLRESERRFRNAARQLRLATDAAKLGVWDVNLANGRLDWDAGMFRIYGIAEKNFGHTLEEWLETLLPESKEQARIEFERSLANPESSYESEFRVRRGDGQIRYIRAMAQAVSGQGGHAERVIGINEDITERKQIEIALVEQVQHTQAILDNIVDGIFTADASGVIRSFNPAATHIFGYTADEVAGCNVSMLLPDPDREARRSLPANQQGAGVAWITGLDREIEGLHKDGRLFPMELVVSEIIQHGQPLFVGMVRDISERKRIERMKNEFISTVSHELRTPLTSIAGALGLIVGGRLWESPKQAEEMIFIAYHNSQRLTYLINDLLDMEKIVAGKLHFELQQHSLVALIRQALDHHQTFSAEHRVQLLFEGEARNTKVRVDSHRLQQVLANLLSNAIKFSPEGGTVRVSVQPMQEHVRVLVADQGPGIPEAFRDRIFEKFSQADSSDTRQKGGTGLGLAITRELVERMSGRVGFDSREGDGATFWFELPVDDDR